MLNRQVAAEARLIAEMYCGLKREAQIAVMANMEGMARTFPDLDNTVEVAQPLPRKGMAATIISDPPGMPLLATRRAGKKALHYPRAKTFAKYVGDLPDLNRVIDLTPSNNHVLQPALFSFGK